MQIYDLHTHTTMSDGRVALHDLVEWECAMGYQLGVSDHVFVGGIYTERDIAAYLEELRPYLVDRLSLTLMNNRQVDPKNFIAKETGGIIMDDDTRKLVITCWQKKKREEVIHPFLGEKIAIGLIPHAQAMLLARNIRGDMDAYPPFLVK